MMNATQADKETILELVNFSRTERFNCNLSDISYATAVNRGMHEHNLTPEQGHTWKQLMHLCDEAQEYVNAQLSAKILNRVFDDDEWEIDREGNKRWPEPMQEAAAHVAEELADVIIVMADLLSHLAFFPRIMLADLDVDGELPELIPDLPSACIGLGRIMRKEGERSAAFNQQVQKIIKFCAVRGQYWASVALGDSNPGWNMDHDLIPFAPHFLASRNFQNAVLDKCLKNLNREVKYGTTDATAK